MIAYLDALPALHRIPVPIPSCHNAAGFSNPDHVIITSSLLIALMGPITVLDAIHTGSDHDILIADFHISVPGHNNRRTFRIFGKEEKKAFAESLSSIPVIDAPEHPQALDRAVEN